MRLDARAVGRVIIRGSLWGAALAAGGPASLPAQPCVPIPLLDLPESVEAGGRVRVAAELTTECNYKVVDRAVLICRYGDGQEVRYELNLFPLRDHTQAEVIFEAPESMTTRTAHCFIEFSQCHQTARTCTSRFEVLGSGRSEPLGSPPPKAPPSESAHSRRPEPRPPLGPSSPRPQPPRDVRPERRPPPPPSLPAPEPPRVRKGGGGAKFFKGLGWIGVAVGAAAYADASTKEQEGRFEEAQESEELGHQILVASGGLLLLGYGIDAMSFMPESAGDRSLRVAPSLALDPVHRAAYVQVTLSFD